VKPVEIATATEQEGHAVQAGDDLPSHHVCEAPRNQMVLVQMAPLVLLQQVGRPTGVLGCEQMCVELVVGVGPVCLK
jgi:hypothetical protein